MRARAGFPIETADDNSTTPLKVRRRGRGRIVAAVVLLSVFVILAGVGVLRLVIQDRMIYLPRRYPAAPPAGENPRPFQSYDTPDGHRYWGYRIDAPKNAPPPPAGFPRFYLVFYGNGSLAVDNAPGFEILARRTGCSFFIVDYRGYGFNPGRPSERGLTNDAIGAYDTLQRRGDLHQGVGVIGHSLGAAVALALATQRPVQRLLLLSPFTSVRAAARATVPWPLPLIARNDWPNEERLRDLLRRPPGQRPDTIGLMHGARDEIIPASMSKTLAALPGEGLQLRIYEEAMHNDILDYGFDDCSKFLRGGDL